LQVVPVIGWQNPVVVSHSSPAAHAESEVQYVGAGLSHLPVVVSQMSPSLHMTSVVHIVLATQVPDASQISPVPHWESDVQLPAAEPPVPQVPLPQAAIAMKPA
jgi:hypothetical protein